MALSIQTNYASLVTQNILGRTNQALSNSQQRLGTGFRVNSAADDAAGLQIATRLNAQSRGMQVAIRNTGDAISLLQTAEGSLNEMTDILQRMKDLATQSANGTNSENDRDALQAEYDQLGSELANIFLNTKYAGDNLFSDGTDIAAAGKFGTDAVDFQIGSDSAETLSLDVSTKVGELQTALAGLSTFFAAEPPSASGSAIATQAGANGKIDDLSDALDTVGALRAQFGANINRLNHTANNLNNIRDNTEVARGRIIDADFAAETANSTKNSMLLQSGIAVLKQSNQLPSLVMSLLG